MTFLDQGGDYYHSAEVYRLDIPQAAWFAEITRDDDTNITSAWTTEAAAKAWVRRILARKFGIYRERLPWQSKTLDGCRACWRLEWVDTGDEGTFKRWGWDL